MVEAIGPAELRRQAEFVKPIFELFEKSGSYSEAMGKLLTVFDDVHPSEMQKVLARAVFLSDMWGRMNSETA
jgi:phage gp29-like protein